jgi:hypothetical protein
MPKYTKATVSAIAQSHGVISGQFVLGRAFHLFLLKAAYPEKSSQVAVRLAQTVENMSIFPMTRHNILRIAEKQRTTYCVMYLSN